MSSSNDESAFEFTLEESLYFGNVPCHFDHVDGQAFAVSDDGSSLIPGGAAERESARLHNQLQGHLGDAYARLVVPGIPAAELVWVPQPSAEAEASLLARALPPLCHRPLLKTEGGRIVGSQSGVRSGLIKTGPSCFLRLKGCGNNYQGFPSRAVRDSRFGEGVVEIRGCTFSWTCHLEAYMTALVQRAIAPHFTAANIPRGWFVYASPPADPFPRVPKYCALFQSLGDKRLGDHVLMGIERLLPLLLPAPSAASASAALLASFFPEDRAADEEQGHTTVLGTDMLAACEMGGYIDAVPLPLPACAALSPLLPPGLDPKWHPLWHGAAAVLSEHCEKNEPSFLALAYWRFGWEAGRVLRAIQAQGISWGTYNDDLGTHCNAHINNLVIRPEDPSQPLRPLLAPLDFDMAFTRAIFLRLSSRESDADLASLDEAQFQEWMLLERRGMECCLAGSDLNSGARPIEPLPAPLSTLRWALRDTACHAYLLALSSDDPVDPHPMTPALSPVTHALIRLALLSTLDVIA